MVLNGALLLNSVLLAGVVTFGALLGGMLAALKLLSCGRSMQRLAQSVAVVCLALPPFTVANTWMDLFGSGRPWAALLPFPLFSLPSAALLLILMFWPIPFLILFHVWRRSPNSLLEEDPAMQGWNLIRHWLVPMARSAISMAALCVFALTLNQFTLPTLLQVKVLPVEIWIQYSTQLNMGAAFAAAWPLVFLPLILLALLKAHMFSWPSEPESMSRHTWKQRLGSSSLNGFAILVMAFLSMSVLLPLGHLLLDPKSWKAFESAWLAGSLARNNSAVQAFTVATLVLGCSVIIASLLIRVSREKMAWGVASGIRIGAWMAFGLPGIFLGMTFLTLQSGTGTPLVGWWLAALVVKYFALGWAGVSRAYRTVDPDLMAEGRMVGMRWPSLLRHVIWPHSGGVLLAAWYLVYVLVLWDVETGVLLQPPGGETLALRIFNLLHYGHNDQVNALSIHLLILALAPAAGFILFQRARSWFSSISSSSSSASSRSGGTPVCLVLAALVGCTTGCSPSVPKSGERLQVKLATGLFQRAEVLGSRGTAVGEFNKPRTVASGLSNELFVVDLTGRIQRFNAQGETVKVWQMPEIQKGKPKGMLTDRTGNLWVVEPHYQRVNCFSRDGQLLRQWGKLGPNPGDLVLPRSIALSSDGTLFLPEYTTVDRVQAFVATNGNWLFTFGKPGQGPGEFNRPEGIALDAAQRIYVADSCNHRIQVFDSKGGFLRTYGKAGSGQGEFSYPYDIKVDRQGRQYVCEFGNSRVQIFDSNDHWLETVGHYGDGPGELNNPWSIALDDDENLYVADAGNHRVVKFVRRNRETAAH